MTADQVEAIGPELTALLQPLERFFDSPKTLRHSRCSSRGLLSDLPRKSAEPIAVQGGTAPRCLQQFLKACLWDHEGLTDATQRTVLAWTISRTIRSGRSAFLMRPAPSNREQRPRRPTAILGLRWQGGQRDRHGSLDRDSRHVQGDLDSELFLPESWDADRPRCQAADIPDELLRDRRAEAAREQRD